MKNTGILTRWLAAVLLAGLLGGCADMGYYAQAVRGHVQLMQAAQPISEVLANPQTPAPLRQRLQQVQDMRRFSVAQLHLPDNASYQRFVALPGRYVVWNVVAAPALSLNLKTWCFPLLGCVGYRGYFAETDARALAAELRAQGLEVSVYGVPAYSTLGWTNWLGGDPLPSSLLAYPDGELARLMFHELAHQVLYVPDDTAFNESFATAVERLGGAQWLAAQASAQAQQAFATFDARRQQFRALTRATRQRLASLYDSAEGSAPQPDLLARKAQIMADFRAQYAQLKASWGGYHGFDAWVAQANNASFAVQAAYDDLVPSFQALFEREGRSWSRFLTAARQLAQHPQTERLRQLQHAADAQLPK